MLRGFLVVLGYTLLIGSPGVSDALGLAQVNDGSLNNWLAALITFPRWQAPPAPLIYDTRAVVFVVLSGVLLWWTSRRRFGRPAAFLAVTGSVTVAALVAAVLGVLALGASDTPLAAMEVRFEMGPAISAGITFGVLFGAVVAALATTGDGALRAVQSIGRMRSGVAMAMAGWSGLADGSEATRAMCAAMHLDDLQSRRITMALLTDGTRAIAPSPGVDLRPVLLHGLDAWRRRRERAILLACTLVATLLLMVLSVAWLLVGFAVATALLARDALNRRQAVRAIRQKGPELPVPDDAEVVDQLAAIDEAQQGNVTVFSGYWPFIGFGVQATGWSLALAMRPKRGLDGMPAGDFRTFTAAELTTHLTCELARIAGQGSFGEPLTGLSLAERVFVSGRAVADDERFLAAAEDAPTSSLTDEQVAAIAADPNGQPRYYLGAHVTSWGGQLVASTFLRFSTDGALLYAACDRTVLPPAATGPPTDELGLDELSIAELSKVAGTALATAIPALVTLPVALPAELALRSSCRRIADKSREHAAKHVDHDYGAALSVRELGSVSHYDTQFQLADANKHLNVVERHVFEALIGFLDAHHVDTTELRDRRLNILNEGVIQTGGTSSVGVQAVGRQASASTGGDVKQEIR